MARVRSPTPKLPIAPQLPFTQAWQKGPGDEGRAPPITPEAGQPWPACAPQPRKPPTTAPQLPFSQVREKGLGPPHPARKRIVTTSRSTPPSRRLYSSSPRRKSNRFPPRSMLSRIAEALLTSPTASRENSGSYPLL